MCEKNSDTGKKPTLPARLSPADRRDSGEKPRRLAPVEGLCARTLLNEMRNK